MRLPEHKLFFAVHGKKAETLGDLRVLISEMKEDEFNHHIDGRNDFSKWVRDILHRDTLADKLDSVKSKQEMLELVEDEITKDKEHSTKESYQFKRFLAREFIFGLLIGLIIGLALSRLMA